MLLLSVVALKEIHHLLDHHHEVAHCDSNGREKHLHSEEYAPVDCLICFFCFYPSEMSQIGFELKPIPRPIFAHSFLYQNPTQDLSRQTTFLRGPPALTA